MSLADNDCCNEVLNRARTATSGNLEAAQQILTQKPALFPHAPERDALQIALSDVHQARGAELWKNFRFREAIIHLKAAYQIDQTRRAEIAARELNMIGLAYQKLNQYPLAFRYFQRALSLCQKLPNC